MSEPKLWGVKRRDGSMVQIKPQFDQTSAAIEAFKYEPNSALPVGKHHGVTIIQHCENHGYTIVRAAVVEVGEEA